MRKVMVPEDIVRKRVLFSALNWGYGHVMRSVVLLKQLEQQGCTIYIAANNEQEFLYRSEGIEAKFLENPGYPFNFSEQSSINRDLLFGFSRLYRYMKREHRRVEAWCQLHAIELVLSDQCMGFYSRIVPSVLITHQVNLPLKPVQFLAQWVYERWMNRFSAIWIPDNSPPNNLAGKMSRTTRRNAHYMGWLSRFDKPCDCAKEYELGALITGPEPYAKEFYEQCKIRFLNSGKRSFIIYNRTEPCVIDALEVLNHQSTDEMKRYLCSAKLLVTRSGYSTLMDLKVLGLSNFELHATQGQREQEYLIVTFITANDY